MKTPMTAIIGYAQMLRSYDLDKMEKDQVSEVFAIATDSSLIFHLDGKDFVKIFDMN